MKIYNSKDAVGILTKLFYKREGTLEANLSRVMRQSCAERDFELIFKDDGVHVKYNIDGKFHDQYKIFEGEYGMDFSSGI